MDYKYLCSNCDKQFTQSANLWTHQHSAHNDKRYPCGKCDYKGQSEETSRLYSQGNKKVSV